VDSGSEIRFCTTLLSKARSTTTEIVEEPPRIRPGTESLIREEFERLLASADALVLSGTKAPGYSADLFPWMIRTAKRKSCLTVLDIKGEDLLACLKEGPDLIKPNFMEFSRTFVPEAPESEHADHPGLEAAVREKILSIASTSPTRVVLTSGPRRILYADREGVRSFQPGEVRAVNTIGCGDALTAGLTASLLAGRSLDESVEQGARCAGLNAGLVRPGVIRT
jgi:fructose-1-phosphate kinase PfkB-like protein